MFSDWDTAEITGAGLPHPSSKTVEINGIFGDAFVEVNGVESVRPMFKCASQDLEDVVGVHNALMYVNGETTIYKVKGVQPNGRGVTELLLERQ